MREAVSAAGVTLMCAHNQLFLPAVAKAKEIIEAGTLGTVYEVRTTDSFFNDFDPENMGWRAHASTSGGGELIDTGYHPTYLMLHLAGGVPVEATAMLSTHRLKFMEGEDSAQVLVRFDNGVVGQLVTSWAYQRGPRHRAVLRGGRARVADRRRDDAALRPARRASPRRSSSTRSTPSPPRSAAFARCLRDGHPADPHRGRGHRRPRHHPGRLRGGPGEADRRRPALTDLLRWSMITVRRDDRDHGPPVHLGCVRRSRMAG